MLPRKLYYLSFLLILTAITISCSDNAVQYEPNSFIKEWLIIESFPNCEDCSTVSYHHDERCEGFYTDYLKSIGGEKNAIPTDGMKVKYSEKNIPANMNCKDTQYTQYCIFFLLGSSIKICFSS